jgi:hypothetical protein
MDSIKHPRTSCGLPRFPSLPCPLTGGARPLASRPWGGRRAVVFVVGVAAGLHASLAARRHRRCGGGGGWLGPPHSSLARRLPYNRRGQAGDLSCGDPSGPNSVVFHPLLHRHMHEACGPLTPPSFLLVLPSAMNLPGPPAGIAKRCYRRQKKNRL